MELNQAFATLEKQLAAINTELHFNREAGAEDALTFAGDNWVGPPALCSRQAAAGI